MVQSTVMSWEALPCTETETPPPHAVAPATRRQHRPLSPVSAHASTLAPVVLSVTVQSSRVVPGRFAIRPWMQGALTYSTISLAMLDSAGEKSSSQIESVVPLAPKWPHELVDAHGGIREAAVGGRAGMLDHRPGARRGAAGRILGARRLPAHHVGRRRAGDRGDHDLTVVGLERLDAVRGAAHREEITFLVVGLAAGVADRMRSGRCWGRCGSGGRGCPCRRRRGGRTRCSGSWPAGRAATRFGVRAGVVERHAGVAEQSSSLVIMTIAR